MSDPDEAARRIYARRRPVADPIAGHYLLPAAEGRRIFCEQIVPELLARPESQDEPVVVFVVGQQGAGKSRIADMVGAVLAGRGGFAELDSDFYKPYHPAYRGLLRDDDRLMAAYLGPDSWAWLAQAHEYVRARRLNVIKHETAQDSTNAEAHLRAYRQAGFRTEVMILAVPPAMSNQGILSRYAEQVTDRGHGRLTVQANADRAYDGVLDFADVIDRGQLADYAAVFRRGEEHPRQAITYGTRTARQHYSPTLRQETERERERPWTAPETADFLRTHRKLRAQLDPQWAARLDEIIAQAQPLMALEPEHSRAHGPSRVDPEAEIQLEADI